MSLFGSYPTYEEWKLFRIKYKLKIFKLVLILPMRNGNLEGVNDDESGDAGSYPTYEEWKPKTLAIYNTSLNRGSYPTYEEWKHFDVCIQRTSKHPVLILPMRNGNDISDTQITLDSSAFLSYL